MMEGESIKISWDMATDISWWLTKRVPATWALQIPISNLPKIVDLVVLFPASFYLPKTEFVWPRYGQNTKRCRKLEFPDLGCAANGAARGGRTEFRAVLCGLAGPHLHPHGASVWAVNWTSNGHNSLSVAPFSVFFDFSESLREDLSFELTFGSNLVIFIEASFKVETIAPSAPEIVPKACKCSKTTNKMSKRQ